MWQILLPKDIEGQEIAIYVKMVMKSLRDSEKTFQKKKKKINTDEQQRLYQ